MSMYEYINRNREVVKVLIHCGCMSPKYLLWFDMFEYVNARILPRKRERRCNKEIVSEAAVVFRTSERAIFRACAMMKQKIKTNTINNARIK